MEKILVNGALERTFVVESVDLTVTPNSIDGMITFDKGHWSTIETQQYRSYDTALFVQREVYSWKERLYEVVVFVS